MKLKLVKLNKDVKIPEYKSKNAAGFDFVANNFKTVYKYCYDPVEDIEFESVDSVGNVEQYNLQPRDRILIGTGLKMEIPEGYELQVRPRSGLALNDGITVVNTPGTIDADYRGEVGIILINHGAVPISIKLGNRVAQGVVNKVEQLEIEVTEEITETERAEGGFGSTGKT